MKLQEYVSSLVRMSVCVLNAAFAISTWVSSFWTNTMWKLAPHCATIAMLTLLVECVNTSTSGVLLSKAFLPLIPVPWLVKTFGVITGSSSCFFLVLHPHRQFYCYQLRSRRPRSHLVSWLQTNELRSRRQFRSLHLRRRVELLLHPERQYVDWVLTPGWR